MVRNQKVENNKYREREEFAKSKTLEKSYKDEIFGQDAGKYTALAPEKS